MELIEEIIDNLTSSDNNLTDALLKTKVIAFKLKNQELLNWVNNELSGYVGALNLPEYRTIYCVIYGTVSNGYNTVNNFPIPILNLQKEMRELLTSFKMIQGISGLRDLASRTGESIGKDVPPEFYQLLSSSLSDGFEVIYARQKTDQSQIIQIISTVRSKLLDFMLSIDSEFQNEDDLNKNNNKISEKVSDLFNSTIFGDNATIIIGSSNTQTVSNKIVGKGDFESLEKLLKNNSVPLSDINDLKGIIDNDNTNAEEKVPGEKVNSWIKKMLGKSVDTTWKVGIGVAGKLLADGIQQYYGW